MNYKPPHLLPQFETKNVCGQSELVEDLGQALNMLKKISLFTFFLIILHSAKAQRQSNVYLVQLKDKHRSDYSLSEPAKFLSLKAIERRERQHISVTASDLPVSEAYINEIRALNVKILNHSRWLNTVTISCADTNNLSTIAALPYVKGIKKIETGGTHKQTTKFETTAISVPAVKKNKSTATTLNYGYSYNQAHQLNADCLHNMGFQGQNMTIAVLDAGFLDVNTLPVFDSMRINNHLLGTRDFVTGDTMVFEDFPHGMNVLSCMAGNLPGLLVGTAPEADYWLLRTEDASSETLVEELNWLSAAEFADSVGADIINSSLGYNYFDNSADDHTYSDMDGNTTIITKAADMAVATGMMVVVSAGNYGAGPWYKITAPADADSVLTVGAVDSAGVIAPLSSRGPTADGRIKPNTVARGLNAVVAGNTGGVMYASGTSFSSPITAGAVACLWQANPEATNMELLAAIEQSATLHSNPDTIMGYGIPDFCSANTILTGIEHQNSTNEKLVVYPNPFEDELEIAFYTSKKQKITITLYDLTGRKILQTESTTKTASGALRLTDFSGIPKGLYILSINTANKCYYEKVVKR
jgi:hypothetical protein